MHFCSVKMQLRFFVWKISALALHFCSTKWSTDASLLACLQVEIRDRRNDGKWNRKSRSMKAKDKYKGRTKNKVKSVDMMYLALRRRKNEFTQLHNHADSVADPRSCRPGDNAGREAVPGGVFCACIFQGLPCAKGRDWRSNKNAGWGCDDDDHDNWCHYLSCRKNLSAFATWVY